MEKLIEKINSYEIFNNLYPGIVFNYLLSKMFGINLIQGSIVEDLFIYYFLGMIISRIGSLIVEPICKKIGWVKYKPHAEYIKAEKQDAMLEKLKESNNTYRTCFAMLLLLLCTSIVIWMVNNFDEILNSEILLYLLLILSLLVLFACAYKKQTKYISGRVEEANSNEVANEEVGTHQAETAKPIKEEKDK